MGGSLGGESGGGGNLSADWNSEADLWVKNKINAGSDLTQGLSEHMCRMRAQPGGP